MGESCRAQECLKRMPNKQKTWLFLSFIIVLLLLAMLGLQNVSMSEKSFNTIYKYISALLLLVQFKTFKI